MRGKRCRAVAAGVLALVMMLLTIPCAAAETARQTIRVAFPHRQYPYCGAVCAAPYAYISDGAPAGMLVSILNDFAEKVELPLELAEPVRPEEQKPAAPRELAGRRIPVAEDNDLNAEIDTVLRVIAENLTPAERKA